MFNVEIELTTPKVPYRETITRKVENVEGKLKKQTGGKGMYGVCYLSVEPLPRGAGFEFVDEIVGGSIPRNLIPAVEKGVLEACRHGPLAGFPVVDIRVRCIDGKHHPVDSNEMAFKLAGSFGFKAAIGAGPADPARARSWTSRSAIPDEYVGDIMGDLSAAAAAACRRPRRAARAQVIKAQVPMSEMLEYASALTSLTGGQGRVPHGVLALRRGARPRAGQDRRGGAGARRRRRRVAPGCGSAAAPIAGAGRGEDGAES